MSNIIKTLYETAPNLTEVYVNFNISHLTKWRKHVPVHVELFMDRGKLVFEHISKYERKKKIKLLLHLFDFIIKQSAFMLHLWTKKVTFLHLTELSGNKTYGNHCFGFSSHSWGVIIRSSSSGHYIFFTRVKKIKTAWPGDHQYNTR